MYKKAFSKNLLISQKFKPVKILLKKMLYVVNYLKNVAINADFLGHKGP